MKLIDDLENIHYSLKSLDEENFDTEFYLIRERMILSKNEVIELEKTGFFEQNPTIKEKINKTTKLISNEYDNKIKLWKSKIDEIAELLISKKNEKKILNYKRHSYGNKGHIK